MAVINFAIQASSISWAGSRDIVMNHIDNFPVIYWTIKKIFEKCSDTVVTIVAPEFDKTGEFVSLKNSFSGNNIKLFFGFNNNPLDRIINAYSHLNDNDYIIRCDGLNYAFDLDKSIEMLNYAIRNNLDCVKFPDDFPIQLTFDIYRIGALRKAKQLINETEKIYWIHPKYYMLIHSKEFVFEYYKNLPHYSEDDLRILRKNYAGVFAPRQGSESNRILIGDQLSFHYELAAEYTDSKMEILDIACGEGYGTCILAKKVKFAAGCDIDHNSIEKAKVLHKSVDNIQFSVENALSTSFDNECFDLITSMETIEHVSDDLTFLSEMKRILRPDGILILSSPQNSMGHIPLNNEHEREYSLDELINLVNKYFVIERILGIKQGRVVIEGNNKGTNTVLFCRKS